jgi:hypothetical protein
MKLSKRFLNFILIRHLGGSTIPLHDHDMYIYDSPEGQVTHALQFLKEGLKNNESCLLVANYSVGKKVKGRRNNLWESFTGIETIEESDIKVVSASDWFFRGQTVNGPKVNNIGRVWTDLSSKRAFRGRPRLRAFVDMSLLFRHQMLKDLVECESRVAKMRNLPIKLICANLESDLSLQTDLSLLSSESYKKICHDHGNVFHFTH